MDDKETRSTPPIEDSAEALSLEYWRKYTENFQREFNKMNQPMAQFLRDIFAGCKWSLTEWDPSHAEPTPDPDAKPQP